MILIIDNYDGCANNIYQLAGLTSPDIRIERNDCITVDEIEELAPSHIILSGGSCRPENAGNAPDFVLHFAGKIPLFGVCLGCRILCATLVGAKGVPLKEIEQGKQLEVTIDSSATLFKGLPERIKAGFYRSSHIPETVLPKSLRVTAHCGNTVAAFEDEMRMIYGVDFHPESFLSEYGRDIMENFLRVHG